MKKLILGAAALAFVPTTYADVVGFTIGGYSWQQQFGGTVRSGSSDIELENQLGIDDDRGLVWYAALEHPIPLLPNVRLQQTEMTIDQQAQLSDTVEFDGVVYPVSTTLDTDVDFSHTDATLYYELLDTVVSLDLGLTLRNFEGDVELSDVNSDTSSSESFDGVIPMLYAAARFDLPLAGLFLEADANGLSVGDATLIDYRVGIGYQLGFGLALDAGYRSFDIDYEDGDERADVTVDGAFVGLYYDF